MSITQDDWSPAINALLPHLGEYRLHDDEVTLKVCPACGRADWRCSVNRIKGAWQCLHASCDAHGGVKELYALLGLPWDPAAWRNGTTTRTRPATPTATPAKQYTMPKVEAVAAAHAALLADEELVNDLRYNRGLTRKVIAQYQLGVWTDPHGVRWLTIPHWQEGTLWSVKRRRLGSDDKPKYVRTENSRSILFNADCLKRDPRWDRVYLTEGELDALALIAAGIPNVVAGTLGAGHLADDWVPQLAPLPEIVIVADNDEAGEKGARKWAERLGLGRCRVWRPPAGKDVGEWLVAHQGNAERFLALPTTQYEAPPEPPAVITKRLSQVERQAVTWLMRGWLPLGKLVVLDGDPGLGKSTVSLDLAARVTRGGAMPNGVGTDLHGPAGVVILTAEDGLADTIRPRLEAAGADLDRVNAIEFVRRSETRRSRDGEEVVIDHLELPTLADLDAMRVAIAEVEAKLVVIDPFAAYLPRETNAHRDQDVRRALAPLAALAEETGATILVIRHLNKASGGNPLYRGGGSIGIIGAARAGLLVAPDPDDPDGLRRVLAVAKSNLGAPAPALAYSLEARDDSVRVVWHGESPHTARSVLAAMSDESTSQRSALEEAQAVLQGILKDGPVDAKQATKDARDAGVHDATLRRAREALGVKLRKEGYGAGSKWVWELPAQRCSSPPEDVQTQTMDIFGGDEHLWAGNEPGDLPPAPAETAYSFAHGTNHWAGLDDREAF